MGSYGLNPVDQDILACSLAPQAEPRLGWMYQELQPGVGSMYPTPALIRELLLIDGERSGDFIRRLDAGAPLAKNKLIEPHGGDLFNPVIPSARACRGLLGWASSEKLSIPGAVEVQATAGWDELVLPETCLRGLREFMWWTTHRDTVMHEWRGRVPGGPVALFSGPSGTGKSFAAEVLAVALGRRLFRVDLGMLVSKYIGETEKNLNALFDAAHDRDVVLLFDEADSLFGKRGEVRDARDRYANMEVGHLLSRIERHQGPCVLTTNLREHMDPAFIRRFQMVIEFPRPDARARAELWERNVPPEAPCSDEIDAAFLGDEVHLTGGQIRNAALHAAFLAAGQSTAIGLPEIARAVWVELAKSGGEVTDRSLGGLGKHLGEVRHDTH